MALTRIGNQAITLDAAEIPNIDASKIQSGVLADARISASSVSQHAQSFDDNKIVNDISTLAIRQASNENKTAYNTNSMYVDVFQDSSGITNLTNCQRDNLEFVASVVLGTPTAIDYFNPTQSGGGTLAYRVWAQNMSGSNNQWTDIVNSDNTKYFDFTQATSGQERYWKYSPGNTGVNTGYIVDYRENKTFSGQFYVGKTNSWGDISQFRVSYSTDNSTYTGWDTTNITQSNLTYDGFITSGGTLNSSPKNTDGDFGLADNASNTTGGSNSKMSGMPEITARYLRLSVMGLHNGKANNNAGISSFQPFLKNLVANATGSFESNAITAPSSVNKMGAVITYQDNAGTNALNTDIVLKLSADGGSNYTTATLAAMPDFSSGIKMAKVNDLTIANAGTSLKYKLEFANQASGSKEARIRGVSLQY